MKAVLIVNPYASRVTPEVVAAVERVLREAGELETVLTEAPGHAPELAAEACGRCDRLYVLSGDGGYNEVVNGLDADGPAVGFLAGGGTSVLPRALGLPRDPVAAARSLVRSERVRTISLGRAAWTEPGVEEREGGVGPRSRRFAFAAGVGLDAELVREANRLGRAPGGRRPGDAAYVRTLALIVLRARARLAPVLTVGGLGRAASAFVANGDPYSYVGRLPVHVAPEARFELGLDLVAPVRITPGLVPLLAWWVLARPRHTGDPRVLYAHDRDELGISCDLPTPLQVDGEDLGDAVAIRFSAERGALDVLVAGPGQTPDRGSARSG
jgi:diacylglycerol kinase family enzyme